MSMLTVSVVGDGKEYNIFFDSPQLAQKRRKYRKKGARLFVLGEGGPTPTVPRRTTKPLDNRGGRHDGLLKAVVCVTTGQFFLCMTDAAMTYGLSPASVSAHINHPDKHKQVKKHVFRYATEAEKLAKKMLHL